MNKKISVMLGTFLVSLYILVPSFLPEGSALSKFFVAPRMNLGLDLRGGIHIVLGVDVQRALDVELDKYFLNVQKRLGEKEFVFDRFERVTGERAFLIHLRSDQDYGNLEKNLREDYFGALLIQGGDRKIVRIVLDPQHEENLIRFSLEQAREIIRNRVDEFGVAEPSIQIQGEDRIVIQLPGIKDPERAIQLIGRTALLEFKVVSDAKGTTELETLVEKARKEIGFKNSFARTDLEALNKFLAKDLPPQTQISFERVTDPKSGDISIRPYLLLATTELTGQALEDAFVSQDQTTQRPQVGLKFNKEGAESFEKITEKNVGKLLAILLDGVVVSAPVIREKIPAVSAGATISLGRGNAQELQKEARDLALVLRSGALPAPVEILENRTVGASLGEDSIAAGQKATLLGALFVIIFMLFYYRWSGFIANLVLIANISMLLAFMSLFQATLTLPGIAGIVLTIGMAVDANVVILERIREELRAGKKIRSALEAGYSGAHAAIFDSNLTTVLSGIVLYNVGSGPIRGFAVTLMVGLFANYVAAVWFSKWIYDWYLDRHAVKNLSI